MHLALRNRNRYINITTLNYISVSRINYMLYINMQETDELFAEFQILFKIL